MPNPIPNLPMTKMGHHLLLYFRTAFDDKASAAALQGQHQKCKMQ
jgi:hypothetical protein